VRDDRVRRVEDGLRRAVILLELDDLCVAVEILEVEDVRHVGATERVDRVVRDQPVGDEVVGLLDVDVVDRLVERDVLDTLDHVVCAVCSEHHHARPDR
jgi:hypothetical protein